jgi:CheY-like chemotaxis protein
MTASPRVLVAVGSDTLALRLRLMIEAEGGEVVMLDGSTPLPIFGIAVAVAAPGAAATVRQAAPGVPMIEVGASEDWQALRDRLVNAMSLPAGSGPAGSGPAGSGSSEAEFLAAAIAHARILLVDDSVTYREFLRLELTRLGAEVSVCPDPSKVLELLRQDNWDCVLIDLVMPGMDGAQLCTLAARLRRDGGGDYALAVLSSREGKADLIRSLEAGADLFLSKSQDAGLFRVKLGALLRQRRLRAHEKG